MSQKGRLSLVVSIFSFVILAGLYFAVRTWMPFMWALLVVSALGIAGWLFLDRKTILDFFTTKTTKQGLNMGALILISIGFLAILNFVGARHYKSFDFSGNKINTLSEQTVKLLKSLDSDLKVTFFYKNGADRVEENKRAFRELIKKYEDISPKVKYEFAEMNEKAKLTQDYAASKGSGEAFVEYKGNKNRIENYTEQDLTNALIKATRTTKKTIYFTEGHGERNIDHEQDETSLVGFKQLLEKNSYDVKKVSLISQGQVPLDTEVLIIAGPTQAFQEQEIKMLEKYLQNGGSLLLALKGSYKGLDKFIAKFGLELDGNYIFNVFNTPMGQVVNSQSPTVAISYSGSSEITKSFGANEMTIYRQPTALKVGAAPEGMRSEIIVQTPETTVALKSLDSTDYVGKPQVYSLGVEVKGKFSTESTKDFELVVFSDVDFMSNILLYQNLNRDLALNAVSSLAKELDLVSVTPKEALTTKLLLSPPEFEQFFRFVIIGVLIPIPLFFMITSFLVWLRRRHA